jgi:diguanylate cyclase (GGDEF)-like protein
MPVEPGPLLSFPSTPAGRRADEVFSVVNPFLIFAAVAAILWSMARLPTPAVRVYPLFALVQIFLFLRTGPLGALGVALGASFVGLAGLFITETPWAAALFLGHGVFFWLLFREQHLLDAGRHTTVGRWMEKADQLEFDIQSLSAREEALVRELEDAGEQALSYNRLQGFADDLIGAYSREELVEKARRGFEAMFPRAEVRVVFFRESNAPPPEDEWGRRAQRFTQPQMVPSSRVRLSTLGEGRFLFVPLRIRDSVIGWATLERPDKARPFKLQDLRLAVIAGDLLSLAAGNAERYAQIQSLSIADGLTGVFTRGYLDERLLEEFAKARHHGRPFSLLILDIDHFKRVNDEHGHRFGDEVLRWLARQIMAQSRDTDFVARYGGEEFVVLMPNTAGPDALAFARRLCRAVGQTPFRWEGVKVPVTISGGVSSLGAGIPDEKELLRRADAALYRAKGEGRNRIFQDE